MDMELRDIVRWVVWALSLGGLFEWARGNIKKNRDDITKIQKHMMTENQEPRFLTYLAHDKICAHQQVSQQEIKEHLKRNDEKLERILVAVTTLRAGKGDENRGGDDR